METNTASLSEILVLTLFLGSMTFLLGIAFQVLIVFLNKLKPKRFLKITCLLVLTRIITIVVTLLIWHLWFFKIDIMYGPILLPAFISEIFFSPLLLKLYGYKILKIK